MPISAVTTREIEHPEIPYDKLRFSLSVSSYITGDGLLRASAQIQLFPARILPPLVDGGESRWEDDPTRDAVIVGISDLDQFCLDLAMEGHTMMASSMVAVVAAVNDYNQFKQVV
jgi:hypothetical protein